jgi:hypothetical protein
MTSNKTLADRQGTHDGNIQYLLSPTELKYLQDIVADGSNGARPWLHQDEPVQPNQPTQPSKPTQPSQPTHPSQPTKLPTPDVNVGRGFRRQKVAHRKYNQARRSHSLNEREATKQIIFPQHPALVPMPMRNTGPRPEHNSNPQSKSRRVF